MRNIAMFEYKSILELDGAHLSHRCVYLFKCLCVSYCLSSTARSTVISAPGSFPGHRARCWAAGAQSPPYTPPWPPRRWSGRFHTERCPEASSLCNPYTREIQQTKTLFHVQQKSGT